MGFPPFSSSASLAISTLSTSSFMIFTFSYPSSVSSRIGISARSISTATTFPAAQARYWVIVPIPGPISSTQSSGPISAARIILSSTCVSMRKFCPNFFWKTKLYFCSTAIVFCGFPNVGSLILFTFSSKLFFLTDSAFRHRRYTHIRYRRYSFRAFVSV